MAPQNRKTGWGRHLLYGAGLLALLLLLAPAWAGAVDLVVDGGATKIVPPSITYDFETIGRTGLGTLTQFSGSNTVSNELILGDQPTGRGIYKLFGGSLSADLAYIGYGGTGNFTHLGGTFTPDTMSIGNVSTGSYTLISGLLSVTHSEYVGNLGSGTFTHIGGTHTAARLSVGDAGSGSYNLVGGLLSTGVEVIGYEGTGSFSQIGGTNKVTNTLGLGVSAGSSGTYHMIGGQLQAAQEFIGYGFLGALGLSTGSFSQVGGDHVVDSNLNLGFFSGGSGTYHMIGGRLQVDGNEVIGNGGTGSFTHASGNHTVNGSLTLGKAVTGSGTYDMKSGNLSVGGDEIIGDEGNGSFTQSSGNNKVSGDLYLGKEGRGTYNLKVGTLKATDEIIGTLGTATFNQTGGNNTVANSLVIGAVGGSGTYNLTGGKLTAGLIDIPNGVLNVTNVVTTVDGNVNNVGTVKTTNAIVTWNGSFTNDAAYISDPSKQTFNSDLSVGGTGYLVGLTSQDLFIIKNDFINHSIQDGLWNTAQAGLKFITGTDTSHNFFISGDGSAAGHPFAWHSLNITGQTLHLQDGDADADGAQWLEALIGAKFTGTTLTNIFNDDDSNVLNLYYDKNLAINAYLGGLDYTITGGAGGMLIAHTPLPPSALLLGSGLLGLGLLGYRRRRG